MKILMRQGLNKSGQSTLEYAMVIAVVVGALVAMRFFVNRAVQGRLRSSVDNIGEQYSAGNTISKYKTTYETTITQERFGTDTDGNDLSQVTGTAGKGVSRFDVITAGKVKRETVAVGVNAAEGERIKKTFQQELTSEGLWGEKG
ncbi:MAG: hypothetical protein ACE5GG_00360 [Candidatus Omnitrophota bacterium]